MADLSFAQAIDALYRVLDLPAPLRQELQGGSHEITFEIGEEPVTIGFRLVPNGRALIVEAVNAARFAEDRSIRVDQMRQVLSSALGLSATNRAVAGIAQGADPSQAPGLAVTARVPLTVSLSQIGAEMKAAVEDVMELVDWQSAHLKGANRGRAVAYQRPGSLFQNEDDYVVLRP